MSLFDKYFIKNPALREAVTKIVYGQKNKTVNLLGQVLEINSLKENGYYRASIASRKYSLFRDEAVVLQNISSLIRGNSTFVDVGANVGVYSSAIARISKLKDSVDVFAFEVDPDTFIRLSANAETNQFSAINMGLSNYRRSEPFVRGAVSHVTTSLDKKNSYSMGGRTFSADLIPLDEADIGNKQKFIKVDIEGGELNMLLGAEGCLKREEIYGFYFDGVGDFSEIYSFLSDFGFSFYNGRTLEPTQVDCFSLLALRR
jgi:FkbM family methyltransferase